MPIAQRLAEIATFQRGPQDLPYSPTALAVVIAIAIGVNLAAIALSPLNSSPWLTLAIFFGYTAAFIDGVLQLRGLSQRRLQTLLAVFGTDIVIVAVQILALGVGDWDAPTPLMLTVFVLLLGWQLSVITHILRHALTCGLGQAAAWTLAYFVGTELLMMLLTGSQ
jgi:hypothetical protein